MSKAQKPHSEQVIRDYLESLLPDGPPELIYSSAIPSPKAALAELGRLVEQYQAALDALHSIESMAGAAGAGETPAMPIAAKAREVLYPASSPCDHEWKAPMGTARYSCVKCGVAASDVFPASDPLGYIELDEHGMCPHDYRKGLGCHVCDPAFEQEVPDRILGVDLTGGSNHQMYERVSYPAKSPNSAEPDGGLLATDLPHALPSESDLTSDLIDGNTDE